MSAKERNDSAKCRIIQLAFVQFFSAAKIIVIVVKFQKDVEKMRKELAKSMHSLGPWALLGRVEG